MQLGVELVRDGRGCHAMGQYVMGWTGDGWITLGDSQRVSLFSPVTRESKNFIGAQVGFMAVVE